MHKSLRWCWLEKLDDIFKRTFFEETGVVYRFIFAHYRLCFWEPWFVCLSLYNVINITQTKSYKQIAMKFHGGVRGGEKEEQVKF